ncbi:unnamed protein product [Anisakis simplex]|uniref:G_PROTEIN_RECEP_F1_2 domain-containing protein n=1 Tax=Anisakis simplex TaxID=6269 RepID=A0A0M3JTC6_ANISI|nr:unnamed protein product [Anisakis simplex]
MPLPLLILFTILAAIIILLTIFGNLLVLFFKARVGRTNTTLLVWNLGLTDFLVGIFVLPLGAFHIIAKQWRFGRFLCRLWVAADVTFCTCSVVTICVISVDRYLAVTRPLRYKSVVTKSKVIIAMIIIWTFSTSILLTTVRWDQPNCIDMTVCFVGHEIRYLAHSVVFAFFLPASVTLTLYWRIYRLARNRQRALDRGFLMILGHNMNFLTNTISQQTALRVHFGKKNGMVEHQRRVLRTHERIAKTLGVVSCSFLFCWLPFFALYLTNYQCKCIPTVVIDIASWLGYCNSMLNPIIYSFTVKEFKRSTIQLILPLWRLLNRLIPNCIAAPPEHIASRVSRTRGTRAKPKRRCSLKFISNRSGFIIPNSKQLINSSTTKRRQTIPTGMSINTDTDAAIINNNMTQRRVVTIKEGRREVLKGLMKRSLDDVVHDNESMMDTFVEDDSNRWNVNDHEDNLKICSGLVSNDKETKKHCSMRETIPTSPSRDEQSGSQQSANNMNNNNTANSCANEDCCFEAKSPHVNDAMPRPSSPTHFKLNSIINNYQSTATTIRVYCLTNEASL